jgi:hypothetical protein
MLPDVMHADNSNQVCNHILSYLMFTLFGVMQAGITVEISFVLMRK